jgi:hypothetical protein
MCILVNGGVPIAFGGTEEPAAYGELISIGGLDPTVNAKLSSTIAQIIQTNLQIHSSRFYIKFCDVQVNFCFLLFYVSSQFYEIDRTLLDYILHLIFCVLVYSPHLLGSMAQPFDQTLFQFKDVDSFTRKRSIIVCVLL